MELIAAIVLVAALAAIALPRFLDLREEARVTTLEGIAGSMRSTVLLVQSKARVSGLQTSVSNPGGNTQSDYVIDTAFGSSEVDWANLCPESRAELDDELTMLDFTTIRAGTGGLQTDFDNRYTRVGYDLPPGRCYVEYDSFGGSSGSRIGGESPCIITVVSDGCAN